MNATQTLALLLREIDTLLDQMFTTGLAAMDAGTIADLRRLAADCQQYGLATGQEVLERLAEQGEQARHSFSDHTAALCECYCQAVLYANEAMQRLFLIAQEA